MASDRPRRMFHPLLAGLLGMWLGQRATRFWLAGGQRRPTRPLPATAVAAGPVSITTTAGIRIHGIQTGVLAIKTAHAAVRAPGLLRFVSIVLDPHWSPLLPVLTWVIEHPTGLVVVDTGEVAAASDSDSYMAADPVNRWIYARNIPLFVTPAEELATQMRSLGLDPAAVRTVVLTHLHGDHTGGLGAFPNATFLVARAEYEGQLRQPFGAVASLWPIGWLPQLVDYTGPAVEPFLASYSLTPTGDLTIVPTPGHSYGHQSVLLHDGDCSYLFAGDLAFSEAQLLASGLQGIAYDLEAARRTLEQTLAFTRRTPTVFLPSHDPQALERFARRATVVR